MSQWLYHKNRPEGQVYECSAGDELHKKLTDEGWVDSPSKLNPTHVDGDANAGTWDGTMGKKHIDPDATTGSGSALGTRPLDTAAHIGILASTEAINRIGKLVDADYDDVSRDLSDDDFISVLDDMSREELMEVVTRLGIEGEPSDTGEMRRAVVYFMRPAIMSNGPAGPGDRLVPDANHPGTAEGMAAAAGDDVSVADELTKNATDPDKREEVTETHGAAGQQADPLTGTGAEAENKAHDPADVALTDATHPGGDPALMSADQREAWLNDTDRTTKAELQAVLNARKVPYKARDSRDELVEAVRSSFATEQGE